MSHGRRASTLILVFFLVTDIFQCAILSNSLETNSRTSILDTESSFVERRSPSRRSSSRSSNEGLLEVKKLQAGQLRSGTLRAKSVIADRILSDIVRAGTVIVSTRSRKSKKRKRRPEEDFAPSRPFEIKQDIRQDRYSENREISPSRFRNNDRVNTRGSSRQNPLFKESGMASFAPKQETLYPRQNGLFSDTRANTDFTQNLQKSNIPKSTFEQTEKDSFSRKPKDRDGLLRAKQIISNSIDTNSIFADHISADQIFSQSVRTKTLRLRDRRPFGLSFFHNTNTNTSFLDSHLKQPSVFQINNQNGVKRSNRFVKPKPTVPPNSQGETEFFNHRVGLKSRVRIQPKDKKVNVEAEYNSKVGIPVPKLQFFDHQPIERRRKPEIGRFKDLFLPVLPTVDHLQYINDDYRSFRKFQNNFN